MFLKVFWSYNLYCIENFHLVSLVRSRSLLIYVVLPHSLFKGTTFNPGVYSYSPRNYHPERVTEVSSPSFCGKKLEDVILDNDNIGRELPCSDVCIIGATDVLV